MCGSSDVWRVAHNENIFSGMWYRGQKPFQCRACRHRFYRRAARRLDSSTSVTELDSLLTNGGGRVVLGTVFAVAAVAFLITVWWCLRFWVMDANSLG
jgi:hypothetical protein